MSNRSYSAVVESSSAAERKSQWVFAGMLLLVLLALAFPEMPPQALWGFLMAGVGGLMLLLPPEGRVPRCWTILAAGFVLFSCAGFLPSSGAGLSPWRIDLKKLGLDTGGQYFAKSGLVWENLATFTLNAVVVVYLFSHRVGTRFHHLIALGFALAVGTMAAVALGTRQPGEVFGFFPNRNHTATLLNLGTFAGLGSLAQAIRRKEPWKIALSIPPIALCIFSLIAVSESRAGVVLLTLGFLIWISLSGVRQLRGNAGKALVLLVIAVAGGFLILDSAVKSRLAQSVGQPQHPTTRPGVFEPTKLAFERPSTKPVEIPTDGRLAIFQDTWSMIRHEPWTGVGPGQFVAVFPQHRQKTRAGDDSTCLHPESDWLMMLAETGWLATFCLTLATVLAFIAAAKSNGRGRTLRMATVTAALLLVIHGLFDVPGHRIGLAWSAALLLAVSLRPTGGTEDRPPPLTSPLGGWVWRILGLTITVAGVALLHAQSTSHPILPSQIVLNLKEKANALYRADQAAYEKATAEGREYDLPPAEDPLEKALTTVDEAISITPLDPSLHYFKGALALYYDNKMDIVNQAFAIHLKLEPVRIQNPMMQAQAWLGQNSGQVPILWAEALRRATEAESRYSQSYPKPLNVFQTILQTAGQNEGLSKSALELAGSHEDFLDLWVRSAPQPLLDREMPRLILATDSPARKNNLFSSWKSRGSKTSTSAFILANPEFAPLGQ